MITPNLVYLVGMPTLVAEQIVLARSQISKYHLAKRVDTIA